MSVGVLGNDGRSDLLPDVALAPSDVGRCPSTDTHFAVLKLGRLHTDTNASFRMTAS
jgi:hypothetical protein